jgi:hypothetical protein
MHAGHRNDAIPAFPLRRGSRHPCIRGERVAVVEVKEVGA